MKLIFAVADIVYSDARPFGLCHKIQAKKYLIRMQLKNCEATLPVFVLILMLNWLEMDGGTGSRSFTD